MFASMATALAQTGLVTTAQAEARSRAIAQREAAQAAEARREAGKRIEARREARRAEARDRRIAAVARITAEDRARFERAQQRVDADELMLVEGVWTWRTGRHAGKTVSAKALAKRGIAPGR